MQEQMKSESVEHKMAAKCWTKVVVDNCKICAKFVLSPTSHLDINCTKKPFQPTLNRQYEVVTNIIANIIVAD